VCVCFCVCVRVWLYAVCVCVCVAGWAACWSMCFVVFACKSWLSWESQHATIGNCCDDCCSCCCCCCGVGTKAEEMAPRAHLIHVILHAHEHVADNGKRRTMKEQQDAMQVCAWVRFHLLPVVATEWFFNTCVCVCVLSECVLSEYVCGLCRFMQVHIFSFSLFYNL